MLFTVLGHWNYNYSPTKTTQYNQTKFPANDHVIKTKQPSMAC